MRKEYYEKNKERLRAKARQRYKNNQEAERAKSSKYREEHREEIRIKQNLRYKERSKDPEYRELQNRKARERQFKIKMKVFNHYSNGKMECACCKEKYLEFLTIDHINGGGNKHRKIVVGSHIYQWLVSNNFPKGYQILCMNCNWAKGHFGICPHNIKNS